jgi:hypothetical protein
VLAGRFGPSLVLLEHHPAPETGEGMETLDLVRIGADGSPHWTRIWPTSEDNPRHAGLELWMANYGYQIVGWPASWLDWVRGRGRPVVRIVTGAPGLPGICAARVSAACVSPAWLGRGRVPGSGDKEGCKPCGSHASIRRGGGPSPTCLADVIETILDKGMVIDAYVRLSLVGIEVLTIDARVVIASVDTYLRFAEAVNQLESPRTA